MTPLQRNALAMSAIGLGLVAARAQKPTIVAARPSCDERLARCSTSRAPAHIGTPGVRSSPATVRSSRGPQHNVCIVRLMAKYGRAAGKRVKSAMHRKKEGTLKSGSGRKVKSRKQAIAIGLSEARKKGAKVPRRQSSRKKR
jgi:Family of unknown function (DUF6496)